MQLGLDISTTTTGYAITTNDSIIELGFVDLKKQTDISDKAWTLVNHLCELDSLESVKDIIVEDSLSGFMRGRTSQQTIIKLAKFNAVVCFLCEYQLQIKPVLVGAMTARKQLFGKSRIKGMTAKEFVKNRVEEKYDVEDFMKYTTRGNWDNRNMDALDALVVSKYMLPHK